MHSRLAGVVRAAAGSRRLVLVAAVALAAAVSAPAAPAQLPTVGTPDLNAPPVRDNEPIVLHGSDLGTWSVPSNQTAQPPLMDVPGCPNPVGNRDNCDHNHFAQPAADTGNKLGDGISVDRFLGYRFDPKHGWTQIPFQVDQVFTRYLDNSASGFAGYSGQDQHTTYEYDREGYRYTANDPSNPCLAKPDPSIPPGRDPVRGLDNNDELAFMAADAGPRMPAGTQLPRGIAGAKEVAVNDPGHPGSPTTYVYVMQAAAVPGAPKPAFNSSNGYVHYARDDNSNLFELSQSSYKNYGNAKTGPYCDRNGQLVTDQNGKPKIERRRPRDYATVTTPRYRFRYDGRWLMTAINISPDNGGTYGPNVIDRWKARAFQQDPSSNTPCCGYEEEDTNWGGSSTLLGERSGPVRAIRETWGADSGTNVIRRETFYRNEMRMKSWLRVHPIPPLDGIYAQWDMAAGRMTRFYNSKHPEGVAIDGHNDEVFGNLDDPCNQNYNANDTSQLDQTYRSFYANRTPICQLSEYHQSIDLFDPTLSQANVALEWAQTSGPYGTLIDRYKTDVQDLTPGAAPQTLVAAPYYRDDSCFDDGTGHDPGPKLHLRSGDEPRIASDGTPRRCWHPVDGLPNGSDHFYQGSIGTHGVHLLFLLESDNARQTIPVDEIVTENRMAMLPPPPGGGIPGSSLGQSYGNDFQHPPQTHTEPPKGVVDKSAPYVKLKIGKHRKRGRIHLTWTGADTGGSGLRGYTLQVKAGGGRWRTLFASTTRRSYDFKPPKGRLTFRLRAADRAGNTSSWAYARASAAGQKHHR